MRQKVYRFAQKPSGIWMIDFDDRAGNRHRISTGVKTERTKRPPPELKVRWREYVLPYWQSKA